MIKTIQEYKESRGITWSQLAAEFGSDYYQDPQKWDSNGWFVVTKPNGAVWLMSPKRERIEKGGKNV